MIWPQGSGSLGCDHVGPVVRGDRVPEEFADAWPGVVAGHAQRPVVFVEPGSGVGSATVPPCSPSVIPLVRFGVTTIHAGLVGASLGVVDAQTGLPPSYDLWHSGVTWRLNSGVPATEVAAWAGHSVEVLMRVYARCMTGLEDVWISRMDDALHLENPQQPE